MSDFDQLLAGELGDQEDNTVDLMEDMLLPRLDQVAKPVLAGVSNVMVDQSPLQPQLQKNKECKCLMTSTSWMLRCCL